MFGKKSVPEEPCLGYESPPAPQGHDIPRGRTWLEDLPWEIKNALKHQQKIREAEENAARTLEATIAALRKGGD